jgi:hypothetical protein
MEPPVILDEAITVDVQPFVVKGFSLAKELLDERSLFDKSFLGQATSIIRAHVPPLIPPYDDPTIRFDVALDYSAPGGIGYVVRVYNASGQIGPTVMPPRPA